MSGFMNTRGFTLIEVLIVVAIVAILASIAYPSYQDSVRKSRRVDAKSALMEVAQGMEAFYARNGQYTVDMRDVGNYTAQHWNTVPRNVPVADRHYQVDIIGASGACAVANCYRLRARPVPGSDQSNDSVTMYQLWSNGRKRELVDGTWSNKWN